MSIEFTETTYGIGYTDPHKKAGTVVPNYRQIRVYGQIVGTISQYDENERSSSPVSYHPSGYGIWLADGLHLQLAICYSTLEEAQVAVRNHWQELQKYVTRRPLSVRQQILNNQEEHERRKIAEIQAHLENVPA